MGVSVHFYVEYVCLVMSMFVYSVCMYACVYMHVSIYIYVCTCVYMYSHVNTYDCAHICV